MKFHIDGKGHCIIDGQSIPALGLGTYPFVDETCYQAVVCAIRSGYRMIDTATIYDNFRPIGKAIKGFDRNELYITSKVWPDAQTNEKVIKDFETSLKELGVEYLDCYMIHWPNSKVPINETLNAMDHFRKEGKLRHIGMSNATCNHLNRALEEEIKIDWVQVEMHPEFFDRMLIDLCKSKEIAIQAWGPLGRGRLTNQTLLDKIGKRYNKSASQVSLRWIIQKECIPLPGSCMEDHIKENIAIDDFELTQNEMNAIDQNARTGSRERYEGIDEFDYSYEDCWPK